MTQRENDEQGGLLDALLLPLTLPRRAVGDLEALGTAARGLPPFERALIEQLDDLGADLRDLRAELNGALERVLEEVERLDGRVAALQVDVPELIAILPPPRATLHSSRIR